MLLFALLIGCLHLMGGGWAQEETWSGFVNLFGDRVDYLCPDDLALSGVASEFNSNFGDRRWEFHCSSANGLANVSVTCSSLAPINSLRSDLDFTCPDDGYLAGFASNYIASADDRQWEPYCCRRPFARVINCEILSNSWLNILRDNLNFSAPSSQVITGAQSFYFNRDRRWRFRTCDLQVDCGDPGVPDNAVRVGNNFLYNDSVTFTCNHGYYQSSGPVDGVRRCLETGLWDNEQPVCSLCTIIPNCADIRCTNVTDHMCRECESNNGPGPGECGYTNLGTECQPKCSWLGSFCYPGVCPGASTSCNCSQGFQGPDCLQILNSPDFQYCTINVEGQDGSEVTLPCQPGANLSTIYTNIVPHRLTSQWGVVFLSPLLPVRPAYVVDVGVGVATSEIQATLYRAANSLQSVSVTTHLCNESAISPDTPLAGGASCSSVATPTDLLPHTFLHGDTFAVSAVTSAGGFLDVLNLDTSQTQRHYYSSPLSLGEATFAIDLEPPTHCSLVSLVPCLTNQNLLILNGEIVSSNTSVGTWGGWLDVPSGVIQYDIDVYYLEYSGGVLREGTSLKSTRYLHTGQTSYEDVTVFSAEGPYSFILKSHDVAGNIRFSRQALLYDFSSTVEIDSLSPLTVVSAHPATNSRWQNSTMTAIVVSGVGHFHNTNFRTADYLAPLANYSLGGYSISAEYDQSIALGRFPRGGTSNALGIIQLSYEVIIDQEGGASIQSQTQPDEFPFQTEDLGLEGLELTPSVQDGDSVTVWFQARDFRFQEIVDSVLVHVDSSPPVLFGIGLEWNGISGLNLHGTGSLVDLHVQFQTFDEHSGIYVIDWVIGTRSDSRIVGSGQIFIPQSTPMSCQPPDCYCDPLHHCNPVDYTLQPLTSDFPDSSDALHDTDYFVTITVTNHALLHSSLSHFFSVDTTPPLQGVVFDGSPGLGDIDYQITFELSAWWVGFFDRETDVFLYEYTFGRECANASLFNYPRSPSTQVVETSVTVATWSAPTNGTYYVTVVAYNQALQPSTPVCSNGITIDTMPPDIVGVVIPGAVISPGLVRDVVGGVWYVMDNRERVWMGSGAELCLNQTTLLEDLSSYPISQSQPPADVCDTSGAFISPQVTYLTSDHVLNVSWFAEDNVGFREYQVRIISAENFTQDESGRGYVQTAGHSHYSFLDPGLLVNGNQFYLSVQAVDLAQHVRQVNIGLIMVDVTPPTFNGSLELVRQFDHVIVTWDADTFVDSESGVAMDSYHYAIGRTEFGVQVADFTPLRSASLTFCNSPFCVAIDTTILTTPLLSGHYYYITIRVTNQAGLSTYVSTTPYQHISGLPSPGYVYDINTDITFDLLKPYNSNDQDISILVASGSLGAVWSGSTHPHLPISFTVGLGTQPGLDDVVEFVSVGTDMHYEYTNLTLQNGHTYFSTVITQNSYGSVSVSSSGVLVLTNLSESLPLARVFDGLSPVDVDYQTSHSSVGAMWVLPLPVSDHMSHAEWALLQVNDGNISNLTTVEDYVSVGRQSQATRSVVGLEEGVVYISAIRACFPDNCLPPVLSDGFQISIPPRPGSIQAVYTPVDLDEQVGISTYGVLELSWEPFSGPQVVQYEWSIGNRELGSELVQYWTQVESFEYQIPANTFLNATISLHKLNFVTVRGFDSAGLYSMSSTPLEWNVNGEVLPQSDVPRSQIVVFDISETDVPALLTDNWKEIEHHKTTFADIDYISSTGERSRVNLSGAWPDLRYKQYSYSVSTNQQFSFCSEDDSTGGVACGVTITNAITVTDLELVEGKRYYFCVQGLRRDAIHPTPNTPPTLTRCSNGVTVDLSPPTSGCVQIISPTGNESNNVSAVVSSGGEVPSGLGLLLETARECSGKGANSQVTSTEMSVVWDEFSDVESADNAVHATGVAYYQVAIGTAPGAVDVTDFVNVGVATYAIVRGLSLQSGIVYSATVRAYDFVGQYTDGFSQPVVVDTSPPAVGRVWITEADDEEELVFNWDMPRDIESGVTRMEWGLGSRPGSTDVVAWGEVDIAVAATGVRTSQTLFSDGQILFLSVWVLNNAGLSMVATSPAYIHDSSPPVRGRVYDGLPVTGKINDLDYSTDLSMLSNHWAGFSDPHTAVLEYFVVVGTEPGDNDVLESTSVGIETAISWGDLTLTHGRTYYTTVTACNDHALCSSSSSNGITVDVTPPISGPVLDKHTGPDVQFQASRSTLSARWFGFYDDESPIQYYTYYIGLAPNDSSLAPPTRTPPSQTSFVIPAPILLPTNRTIYTTVIAWNGADLTALVSSSGVYIDSTPPDLIQGVTIATGWAGSVGTATQYSRSAMQVQWEFEDILTAVDRHFWTIVPEQPNVRVPIPGKVAGVQTHDTVTDVELQDGQWYRAMVISCDQADLCLSSISDRVLVDSSPPIDGYFAVDTDTTAVLNRTVPGGMTWRNRILPGYAELNIAFLGFSDPHSNISEYWIGVGTSYSFRDLTMTAQPVRLDPVLVSPAAAVYLATVKLNRLLTTSEIIYISLWSINGVGLRSQVVQGSFSVDPVVDRNNNGSLTLLRSSTCRIDSCVGHCTCGARGQRCAFGSQASCEVLTGSILIPERQLTVAAVSPQLQAGADDSTLYTAVTDKLIGAWEYVDQTSNEIQRLEWSVSEQGFPPGVGVTSAVGDSVWTEASSETMAIFSASESQQLRHGISYNFHIRVWYSDMSYAIFTSNSITIDTVGTVTGLGKRVREDIGDFDFLSVDADLRISFEGAFVPTLSGGLATYEVAIGDSPGSDNVLPLESTAETILSFSGLDLQPGRTYYSTVHVTTPLGVVTRSISNGVLVDHTPPNIGHVFSGSANYNLIGQTNTTVFSARWIGFNDELSGVHHYELILTDSPLPPAGNDRYQDIGIALQTTLTDLTLTTGTEYFPHVVAVNNAGTRSEDATTSSGLIVDLTGPVSVGNLSSGPNLLTNPSFEGLSSSSSCPDSPNNDIARVGWQLSDARYVVLAMGNLENLVPYSGCNSLLLSGTLMQTFATEPESWYKLSLLSHGYGSTSSSSIEVSVDGSSMVCHQEAAERLWMSCEMIFTAVSPVTALNIRTTSTNSRVAIDDVMIVKLVEYSLARAGQQIAASAENTIDAGIGIGPKPFISKSETRINANWQIVDPESSVEEFLWAVGTVPGGQQKQTYKSTGNMNQGVSEVIKCSHGEVLHITVVARNSAGLTELFYSRPFVVDLTPPTLNGSVYDGQGYDLDYQTGGVVWVDWSVAISDRESGLLSCRWAIGTDRGTTDVQLYVTLPGNITNAHSNDLSPFLSHGTTVYSTVTCLNGAGSYTTGFSDGVTILTTPPQSVSAYAHISSPHLTNYDSVGGYIPTNSLILTWGGFQEVGGTPLTYEVRLSNESREGEWKGVESVRQLILSDVQLPLSETSHVIEVRAVNLAGVTSGGVANEIFVLPEPPLDTETQVNVTWLSSSRTQLDWTGKFSSPAPLRYEISLGTQMGSGSVLKWVELSLSQSSLIVSSEPDEPGLMRSRDYFLSLTAISSSGLHTTASQTVSGVIMTR